MKHSNFSRALCLILAMVMVLSMAPVRIFAAEPAVFTRVDVTDPTDITAGTYLIYGTSSQVLEDGSASAFMSARNSTETRLMSSDLEIVDGSVTTGDSYSIWNLTEAEGGFLVQNAANGMYLYYGSNSGNNIYQTEDPAAAGVWTVVANGDYWTLQEVASSRQLSCNRFGSEGSHYLGFSSYSNTSSTLRSLEFFRLEDGSEVPEPTDPVEPDAPIADGDQVVIYAPAYGKALSTVKTGNYNVGVDVTMTDGVLTGFAETEVFTVIDNSDGSFSFAYEGQNLGMADSYASMNLGEVHDDWTLTDLGGGLYNILNVGRGNYMEWYDQYSNWSTYNSANAATDGQFQLSFYIVTGDIPSVPDPDPEPTVPSEPEEPDADAAFLMTEAPVDGDTVIIYNPANTVVLGAAADGNRQAAIPAAAENGLIPLTAEMAALQVAVQEEQYLFVLDGKYLTSGDSGNSLSFSETLTDCGKWTLEQQEDGSFVIMNVGANYNGNYNQALEYYSGFTTYGVKYGNGAYLMDFYLVTGESGKPESTLPNEGDQVVIYNLSAQGVLGAENDTQSIENVTGYVEDNTFIADNGAVVFTVSKNGDYYRFYNETYGYLCSNGTGNNAFYTQEVSEDADWLLHEGKSGGWNLESRTAKYNGTYSQYLEYYADSYKTYSMYNVTDYDIYEFFFYPLNTDFTMGTVVGGIVNYPQLIFSENAPVKGQDWVVTFTVDAIFGLAGDFEIKVFADPTGDGTESYEIPDAHTLTGPDVSGVYTITVPASVINSCGAGITLDVTAEDTTGHQFGNSMGYEIIDEPSITDISPAANSTTGENKRPTISATLVNAGYDATAAMTVNGEAVEAELLFVEDGSGNGLVTWTPAEDLPEGRTSVTVTVTRADGKTAEKSWSFTVGEAQFELYFGQLHSHTTYSDGSGSLESALDYIGSLPESANVDFVAFTDHSNYFDTTGSANPEGAMYDMSLASASSQELWNAYKGAIAEFNEAQSNVVALGGFEMTWSGGPGHINTFATPGIVSRNNSTLNDKTGDAGMKAYYALLSQAEGVDSISQFNHPGTTFGNFSDFAYWDALIDTRIQLVEVGNGEGQVGAGGYYPSYEQYTMALDKGWHVAPTNNQDNHKGKWGNANDARDVILTADFTEEGIYEAIRAYRVYATEDKNLELGYSVNGKVLGSIIEEVPEVLNFEVTAYDPDSSDSLSKVEVIVNSGKVAHVWDDPAELNTGVLTAMLAPDYSYYYIRVTQGDGDIAVTAPVWVGETLKLGISSVVCGTSTPVTGEELTISTTLFNSEPADAAVKSLTYTVGSQVLAVDNTGYTIPASGSATVDFAYIPEVAKVMNVTVTVVVELEGVEYTFSMDVQLDVQDASKLVYIGIDASHYNEYVAGNYKDSMGNFGALAAGYSVRTVELKTSEELIAACANEKYAALILTAPSRRLAAAQEALLTYTAEELAAIQEFNANGGTVILAGWSDNYENYDAVAGMTAQQHMAATQNALLEALGSSLRITDDATHDNELNGGQTQRLYFNAYNYDSFLVDGVEVDPENPNDRLYTEVYSQYGGATIHVVDAEGAMTSAIPATVTPIVFGHTSTYSKDSDNDGIGGDSVPKYAYAEGDDRLMVLASEELDGQGLIIVSGAAFMSNFEVQATIEDSGSEKNYSNYKICENLVQYLNPVTVTDIAAVQAEPEEGVKYTIEGIVTSNASGYDKDTAFFDCIYLQDGTAGINAFPVAGNYKIGDKVRITGTTSSYQGERQIAVTKIELISEGNQVAPVEITASQLNDGSVLGSLITLKGTVESFEYANGLIQTIMVKDAAGEVARVFIDGYITTSYDVADLTVGARVTVTGLASYDNSFDGPAPRIRIRDRRDVLVTVDPASFVDVSEDQWFYEAVCAVVDAGIMKGTSGTTFTPGGTLTRAEWVTMLYRAAGSPAVTEPSSFTDVPADLFFADAFAWAEDEGIINGVGGGMGAPYMTITREQMVTMLYRFDGENRTPFDLSAFTDVDSVSYYAFDAFEWAVAGGYVNGMTATTLAPQATTNRAQAATILARYLGLI